MLPLSLFVNMIYIKYSSSAINLSFPTSWKWLNIKYWAWFMFFYNLWSCVSLFWFFEEVLFENFLISLKGFPSIIGSMAPLTTVPPIIPSLKWCTAPTICAYFGKSLNPTTTFIVPTSLPWFKILSPTVTELSSSEINLLNSIRVTELVNGLPLFLFFFLFLT